jgi:hypothetical protein
MKYTRYYVKLSLILASIVTIALTLVGCSSLFRGPNSDSGVGNLIPESDYYSLIEKQTRKKQLYDGVTNVLDMSATLLNDETSLAQVDHNARIYQYTQSQYNNEKGTAQSNLAKHTEIFLSFYIPDKKYDDLAKRSTKWKVFLDVAGQRYEPKIIKIKSQLAEVQSLYPNHTRWSTPYKLIFPVSTSVSENGKAKLTLTGPITSTQLEF